MKTKKSLLLFLLIVVVLVPALGFAGYSLLYPRINIEIISPSGGEVYKAGDTMTIKWTPENLAIEKAYLEQAATGALTDVTDMSSMKREGSFSFQIPFIFSIGEYKVKILRNYGFGNLVDVSEPFSIIPPRLSTTPIIYSLVPDTGPIGTQFTIMGNGFSQKNNDINFGVIKVLNLPSFSDNEVPQYIIYTVPQHGNCIGTACETIEPGIYNIKVTTPKGVSNELRFNVTR